MTTQYRCLQSLRYLAEVGTNLLNSRNSRSLDLSRFRLLRRKGALDLWRWPPRRPGGAAYRRIVVRRE